MLTALTGAMLLASAVVGGCSHPLGVPRSRHRVTALADGGALVVGGANSHPPLASVGRYDAKRRRWRAAAPLPQGRVGHTLTRLRDGRVLVAGGHEPKAEPLASALIYDPLADRWEPAGPMSRPRERHLAALLPDGRVLVVGGADDSAELYDPATRRWSLTAPRPSASRPHTASTLHDGRVLLVGELVDPETGVPAAHWYDPRTNTWGHTGPHVQARAFHTATPLPDGRIMLAGGRALRDGHVTGDALDSTELYIPRTNSWREGPRLAQARSTHTTTLAGRVLVVAAGSPSGWGGERALKSVELFDLATGARHQLRLARNRTDHEAVAMKGGDVLLVGGRSELIVSKWNLRWAKRLRLPRRWRKAASRPTPRRLHESLDWPRATPRQGSGP